MSMDNSDFVHVTARYSGGGYNARAGFGVRARIASSTDNPQRASKKAAAKFFRCGESSVYLRVTQLGSCGGTPWLMTAMRKDAL